MGSYKWRRLRQRLEVRRECIVGLSKSREHFVWVLSDVLQHLGVSRIRAHFRTSCPPSKGDAGRPIWFSDCFWRASAVEL